METLFTIIPLTFLIGLLVSPILIFRYVTRLDLKFKFVAYIISGLSITAFIMVIFAWWSYTSDFILLRHYGFNADGMSETEFYTGVLPENVDRVKRLQAGTMGIGWPLKAIIMFLIYSPYLLIVYFFSTLFAKRRLKNSQSFNPCQK